MTFIGLVIVIVALATGMSADAFIDATGETWGPILLVLTFLLALFGDIKRGF